MLPLKIKFYEPLRGLSLKQIVCNKLTVGLKVQLNCRLLRRLRPTIYQNYFQSHVNYVPIYFSSHSSETVNAPTILDRLCVNANPTDPV